MLAPFEIGAFRILPLDESDLPSISAILTKYRDLRLQLADAALLHLANRESIDTIFTLDRRDFDVCRLKTGSARA
jgi:predicted nucleic acid-binding protein